MKIEHDKTSEKFFTVIDEEEAFLRYRKSGENTLDFHYTYTPVPIRGRGIAGEVVKVGLEYAKAEGLKVIPSCPYVKVFIEQHTEYQDLVA